MPGEEQLPVRVPAGPEHDEVGGEESQEWHRITIRKPARPLLIRQLTSQRGDRDRAAAEGDNRAGGDELDYLRLRRERGQRVRRFCSEPRCVGRGALGSSAGCGTCVLGR